MIGFLTIVIIGATLTYQRISSVSPTVEYHSPPLSSAGSSSSRSFASIGASTSALSSVSLLTLPSNVLIDVPFSPQAPLAQWDALHEEACEEMSLLMVVHFKTSSPLTPAIAEREIQDLVAWETAHGYPQDVTVKQLAEIASRKFGLPAKVINDVSAQSIKEQLAAGHPIIVPAAGRELHNPYFSGAGPWYHMLVIIGYRHGFFGDYFITDDPGTKRGRHYEYDEQTLLNAIHDWAGKNELISQGKRTMLILP